MHVVDGGGYVEGALSSGGGSEGRHDRDWRGVYSWWPSWFGHGQESVDTPSKLRSPTGAFLPTFSNRDPPQDQISSLSYHPLGSFPDRRRSLSEIQRKSLVWFGCCSHKKQTDLAMANQSIQSSGR